MESQPAKVKFYVLRPNEANSRATKQITFKVANFKKGLECLKKEKQKGETIVAAYFEGDTRERNIKIDPCLYN
jgi:DNA-binding protein YbaB